MATDKRPGPAPFEGAALALITVSLALAVFMNVLDTSIANVSVPTIAGDLAVSADQGTWIITSFAVSNAIAVPLTGWLAKRFGEVRLFVVCTLLFTLTSWLCGLSFTFPMLLLMRTAQGAVAGPMIPLSQSLLLANYPSEKRGLANGIWGMTAVVGPVAGPILGGWITDNISWSWIFYINLPIGIAAALITWMMLKDRETETARLPIDVIGLALLIVGVSCLQIMLDKGNDAGWFQSAVHHRHGGPGRDRLRLLHRLGAHRRAAGGRPLALQAAQLHDRHHRRDRGLHGLFRRRRGLSALAPDPDGLHGHLGRPRDLVAGHGRHHRLAAGRPPHRQDRRAHHRHRRHAHLLRHLLLQRGDDHAGELQRALPAAASLGHRARLLLHSR